MPTSTRLLTLVALLALPLTSVAGPVDWTYTSTFHAVGHPNIPYVYIGTGGLGAGGSYALGAALKGLLEEGFPTNPGNGPHVSVGHFEIQQHNSATLIPPTFEKNFVLNVMITDVASGRVGGASFSGFAESEITTDLNPNPVMLHLTSDATQQLHLGANLYDIELSINGPAVLGGNGDMVATIGVRPANTPEPATLALAGIGLFGALGWRRCRKG